MNEAAKSPYPPAMRDKHWDERDDAQKLSALRDEVVTLHIQVAELRKEMRLMLEHRHAGDSIVFSIDSVFNDHDRLMNQRIPVALEWAK